MINKLKCFYGIMSNIRNISCTQVHGRKTFNRTPTKFTKVAHSDADSEEEVDQPNNLEENVDDEYKKIVDRTFRVPSMGHQVFVIQPYVKWGAGKKRNTSPELQLAESCTLISTLSQWTVVSKTTVSLMSLHRTTLFGKGNLEKFEEEVAENPDISAVFISIDILKNVQREFLEKMFKVPVYDRYSIVIQIFREHAVSREAKLQIKLAELPYLRTRVTSDTNQPYQSKAGETFLEYQRNIIRDQEKKIRAEIESLRNQRNLLRKNRQKNELPVVAVVGYTNCGKTSLIKALTNEEAIIPKNVLFATLDVTAHQGILPSNMKCVYIDTIGFISDIPTGLLESFVATLEDALLADVIVHVRDVSHPDALAQHHHVEETLRQLNLSENLINNIITVGNKIDLLSRLEDVESTNMILTSAVKLQGIDDLKEAVEGAILKSSDRTRMQIRVPTGGEEYLWLRRQATVCNVQADPKNEQYSLLSVIITSQALAKFKYQFITSRIK